MKDLAVSLSAPIRIADKRPAFPDVLPALRITLDVDAVALYRPRLAGGGAEGGPWTIDVLGVAAEPQLQARVRGGLKKLAAGAPAFGGFDPLAPVVAERNAVVRPTMREGAAAKREAALLAHVYPHGGGDLVRVLLCDGPVLLGVLTVFNSKTTGAAAIKRLQATVPALARRLAASNALNAAAMGPGSAGALLDALSASGFLVDDDGAVLHANPAGRAALASGGAALGKRIAAAAASGKTGRGVVVVPLGDTETNGDTKRRGLRAVMIVEKTAPAPLQRLEAFAREGELTPRQVEVLRELLRGSSNKKIAETLDCAEVTVEVHVSALLRKGKVKSRAALLAKLWAGG